MENLRLEIERLVVAHNRHLKDTVKGMDVIILLRNLHPSLRTEYARKLNSLKGITNEQLREFSKI